MQAADAPALAASLAAVADLPVALALGSPPLSLLDDADVLCLSGGVPVSYTHLTLPTSGLV